MLVIAGFIHLLPVSGVLGVERLNTLYGLTLSDPNIEILMRHRAVLFGVLGVFLIYAAVRPAFRALAIVAGLISVASFIVIALLVGDYNAAISRVVIADVIAIIALLAAALIHFGSAKKAEI